MEALFLAVSDGCIRDERLLDVGVEDLVGANRGDIRQVQLAVDKHRLFFKSDGAFLPLAHSMVGNNLQLDSVLGLWRRSPRTLEPAPNAAKKLPTRLEERQDRSQAGRNASGVSKRSPDVGESHYQHRTQNNVRRPERG
jgi:hypothetical protein